MHYSFKLTAANWELISTPYYMDQKFGSLGIKVCLDKNYHHVFGSCCGNGVGTVCLAVRNLNLNSMTTTWREKVKTQEGIIPVM